MGLFSISRMYFSPSSSFFSPQKEELRVREGLRHMSLFVLASATQICFVKTNPRAPALPLTGAQWRSSELRTKNTSHGALDITREDRAEKVNTLGDALAGCIGYNCRQDGEKLIRVQKGFAR